MHALSVLCMAEAAVLDIRRCAPGACILALVVRGHCVGVDPVLAIWRLWYCDIRRHDSGIKEHHACLRVCRQTRLHQTAITLPGTSS